LEVPLGCKLHRQPSQISWILPNTIPICPLCMHRNQLLSKWFLRRAITLITTAAPVYFKISQCSITTSRWQCLNLTQIQWLWWTLWVAWVLIQWWECSLSHHSIHLTHSTVDSTVDPVDLTVDLECGDKKHLILQIPNLY